MQDVFVLGVGMTPFGRHLDKSCAELGRAAAQAALADAGLGAADLDAAFYANTAQGLIEGQDGVKGQHALRPLGVERAPVFNIENACTGSSSALNLAFTQVASGQADVVLVVGAEKLNTKDPARKFAVFNQPDDLAAAKAFVDRYWDGVADVRPPEGVAIDESLRSVFMDIYAIQARLHMKRYGTTWEQMAQASSKNHGHSVHNPLAQFRQPMSAQEVLQGRVISWPLTLPMCAPISDGAAATVIGSRQALARARQPGHARVRLLASVVQSGSSRDIADQENAALHRTAQMAYRNAGLRPSDISVAEVHDASAFSEIAQVEQLGFCDWGQGGPLVASGATTYGGRIPVNLSGGLQSKGHPVAATGLGQVHELTLQLRGQAEGREVAGARYALAANGGGFMGVEEAVSVVTLLGREA